MTPEQSARWHRRDSNGVQLWVTYGPEPGRPVAVIANDPRNVPADLYIVRVECAPGNVAKRATMECTGAPFQQVVDEAEGLIKTCGYDLAPEECRYRKTG